MYRKHTSSIVNSLQNSNKQLVKVREVSTVGNTGTLVVGGNKICGHINDLAFTKEVIHIDDPA